MVICGTWDKNQGLPRARQMPYHASPSLLSRFIFGFVQGVQHTSVFQYGADLPLLRESAECSDYRHGPLIPAWVLDLN